MSEKRQNVVQKTQFNLLPIQQNRKYADSIQVYLNILVLAPMNANVPSEARHLLRTMIVSRKGAIASQLRQVMMAAGFNDINVSNSFLGGLKEAKERDTQIILFDAETAIGSEISSQQFVEYAKKLRKDMILIAVSQEPSGDNLFSLLQVGTKGFLIPPFTPAALEEAFEQIKEGNELSEDVLQAEDRDTAFAKMLADDLDRLAKNVRANERRSEEASKAMDEFRRMVKMARFFSQLGDKVLFQRFYDHVEQLASKDEEDDDNPKTRLRKTREKLRQQRLKELQDEK